MISASRYRVIKQICLHLSAFIIFANNADAATENATKYINGEFSYWYEYRGEGWRNFRIFYWIQHQISTDFSVDAVRFYFNCINGNTYSTLNNYDLYEDRYDYDPALQPGDRPYDVLAKPDAISLIQQTRRQDIPIVARAALKKELDAACRAPVRSEMQMPAAAEAERGDVYFVLPVGFQVEGNSRKFWVDVITSRTVTNQLKATASDYKYALAHKDDDELQNHLFSSKKKIIGNHVSQKVNTRLIAPAKPARHEHT